MALKGIQIKSTFEKEPRQIRKIYASSILKEGTVLLSGTDIYREMDSIALRKKVGMVFQQPNPFRKTVYENVAYGPRINGINKKE